MIVPIIGNVTYTITLDPTVWIFDDRKIEFERAFDNVTDHLEEEEDVESASRRWDRAVSQQHINPPINRSISKLEGKKILEGTYVMPIDVFINHAEPKEDAKTVILLIENGDDVNISLDQLRNSYLLFAVKGKPIKEEGPVHLYFKDGSNKDNPVKAVQKIIVN